MKATGNLNAVFQALSDPIRRDILGILRAGERTTGELADRFPVTRPAVSRHLRVLHEARLVERRKEGRNQIYSLAPEPLEDARDWLDRYARHWRGALERLKTRLEEESGSGGAGGSGPETTGGIPPDREEKR